MFLLDTNVLSELRRLDRANENVRRWSLSQPAALFHISVVTVLELERGILRMARRDPRQGADLRKWFEDSVLGPFRDRTLPVDIAIARRCAALHVPDPRPERDAFIAATALVHGMTVVTRDVADFTPMNVSVLNPWEWGADA